MKILFSYPIEHDKTSGRQYERVLTRLGHEVIAVNSAPPRRHGGGKLLGYTADVEISDILEDVGGADLYLYMDPLGLIPAGLERAPIRTACILCDAHRQLQPRLEIARFFDHVFLYHRNYIPAFEVGRAKGTVHWKPYACDLELFRDLQLTRDLDVAFVGQGFGPGTERSRVLTRLAETWRINEQRPCRQDQIPEIYSRARIVVNMPLADDLNFRFFEAMSCGAMLLTRRVSNGQEALFQENVHFAAYADEAELLDKVAYFLGHESERAAIAKAGLAEIVRAHDLRQRLNKMLETITRSPRDSAPIRQLKRGEAALMHARILEREAHVEAVIRARQKAENASQRLRITALAARGFVRALRRSLA